MAQKYDVRIRGTAPADLSAVISVLHAQAISMNTVKNYIDAKDSEMLPDGDENNRAKSRGIDEGISHG